MDLEGDTEAIIAKLDEMAKNLGSREAPEYALADVIRQLCELANVVLKLARASH